MDGHRDRERRAVEARRAVFGVTDGSPEVGLALSGGGIRSATFSLGLLRALSEERLLPRIDYLSTVSGGGYTGTFYCGLFVPRPGSDEPLVTPDPTRHDVLSQAGARRALAYLRQSGRYLTPAGARDYLYAAALLVRNWVALTLVMGAAIVLCAAVTSWLRLPLASAWPAYRELLWPSPLVAIPVILLPLLAGVSWGYWLTQREVSRSGWYRPPLVGNLAAIAGTAVLVVSDPPGSSPGWSWLWSGLLAVSAIALVSWLAASLAEWRRLGRYSAAHQRASAEDRVRQALTACQASLAAIILGSGAVAAADSLAFRFSQFLREAGLLGAAALLFSGVGVPAARSLIRRTSGLLTAGGAGGGQARSSLLAKLGPLIAFLAAVVFALVAVLLWGGLTHLFSGPVVAGGEATMTPGAPWILAGSLLAVLLISYTDDFVNLSSLATFYAARLRRAYLGAGNPNRVPTPGFRQGKPVGESDPGDDLGLEEYFADGSGAPVHIINVTINETRSTGAATVQRDRHGRNLAISPGGLLYSGPDLAEPVVRALGEKTGGVWKNVGKPGQSLPVSAWVGISGAAFTTGLGSRTNLAYSMLAFMANVRLGHWWRRDRTEAARPSTYSCLLDELTAGFRGVDGRLWYLSDGGHFENTGAYELVRRRVPFIVASDNGCDPAYGFEDVANLVRKARIDFGAQIDMLSSVQLDLLLGRGPVRRLFAPLEQFADPDLAPDALATIGRIAYEPLSGGRREYGTLLLIKPRLTRNGSADLMRYLVENPDFPQQTTLDQFFDEAQWESYYELGRRIGSELFRERRGDGWTPRNLTSVDWGDDRWEDRFG